MPLDPNAKCTCGYRKFRENRAVLATTIAQWLEFDSGDFGGFGSTPFGTFFGTGMGTNAWGEFEIEVPETRLQLACEKCGRIRSDKHIASFGIFGSYVFGDSIYILTTSALNLGCLTVRFSNVDLGTVDVTPTIFLGVPLPLIAPAPVVTAPAPPPGATLATVLRAVLPDVDHDGEYVVSIVDSCSGTTTFLATLMLESSVQVHTPREAELDGLPSHLIESSAQALLPIGQPGTGSIIGIPFDKCDAVIEYDARFGTDPLTQGWQNVNSSGGAPTDYALVDGGVLNFVTPNPSYWRKTLTLLAAPTSVHVYSKYRVQTSTTGFGQGFEIKGIGAPGASVDYKGVRYVQDRDVLSEIDLPNLVSNPVADRVAGSWTQLYAGNDPATDRAFLVLDDGEISAIDSATVFGTQPGGAVAPRLRGEFGNTQIIGGVLTGQIRNFILSCNGRFTRAFFRSYAAVAAPVLRMQFVSDLDAVSPSARFLIRYGSLGLGTNPYTYGALSVGVTALFTNPKNLMVEVSATLPTLTARQPFWFSVERDWAHVDDITRATVHLLAATVRST